MRIIKLESENVKRLKVVEITPTGDLVFIRGENGQGKTSALDSIAYVLGGVALCPPEVIRRGQANAEATVDLGEFIVTRRWTAKGSTLSVKTRDGAKYGSPQTILDGLVGKLSFDPLAFNRSPGPEQFETMRKLVGVDFTIQNMRRADIYAQRTLVNRDRDNLKGACARMPEVEAPDEAISIADLLAEQDRIAAERNTIEAKHRAIVTAAEAAAREEENTVNRLIRGSERAAETETGSRVRVKALEDRIGSLEKEIEDARAAKLTKEADVFRLANEAAFAATDVLGAKEVLAASQALLVEVRAATVELPSLDAVRSRLAEADEVNAKVRAKKARADELAKFASKDSEAKALTTQLDAIDEAKAAALSAATFPIPGLSLGEFGVTFDGLPLEQASGAQQLQVSLAVALALNPKLRVVLIRDASLLDKKSLAAVAEFAAKHDAQVWLECVGGEVGPAGVIIEDGEVAFVDGVAVPSRPGQAA